MLGVYSIKQNYQSASVEYLRVCDTLESNLAWVVFLDYLLIQVFRISAEFVRSLSCFKYTGVNRGEPDSQDN